MEQTTREPAVAGTFYPKTDFDLKAMINKLLSQAQDYSQIPKALIVPHAGYVYSGLTAAAAYKGLLKFKESISRVVLLGPSHHITFHGMALPEVSFFNTPLGKIPLDTELIEKIERLPYAHFLDGAHADEHSLEVQLPFLQVVLDDFKLVPILVGNSNSSDISDLLEFIWGDEKTLVIVSTDLSHYLDYMDAKNLDHKTSQAILNVRPNDIKTDQACGRLPVQGLLNLAQEKNLKVYQLDLRNSGDTAGMKDQVVGYGAYAFCE